MRSMVRFVTRRVDSVGPIANRLMRRRRPSSRITILGRGILPSSGQHDDGQCALKPWSRSHGWGGFGSAFGALFSISFSSCCMRSFHSLRYLLIIGIAACAPSRMTAGNSSRTFWPTGEE